MSYILDALRRADAERERDRGGVPGLHAQPIGTALAVSAPPSARPVWLWLALGLSLVGLAALSWWVLVRPATPGPARAGAPVLALPAVVQDAPLAPVAGQPTPRPSALEAVGPGAPAPAARVAGTPAPPRLPAPPVAPVRPPGQVAPAAAPGALNSVAPPSAEPADAVASLPPGLRAAATAALPASAALPRALSLAELSPGQRSELPPMAMGGSIYSDSAASRFIIINGQVVREAETAAPGVTVERIGAKSVVLRWRGLRLEVPL